MPDKAGYNSLIHNFINMINKLELKNFSKLIIGLLLFMTLSSFDEAPQISLKKITLNVNSKELSSVFKEIEHQTKLTFFYSNDCVDVKKKVTINVKEETLDNVLLKLLGEGYVFSQKDNFIVIKEKQQEDTQKITKKRIDGFVTDSKGVPLPGVNVIVKGSRKGIATDEYGRFTIEYQSEKGIILQISCMGYETQEINCAGKESLKVVLVEKGLSLEDVVVTGYATINKSSFTGSAITVRRDELLKSSPNNVIQSIQLFDPSFRIIENNEMGSDPNTLPEIYIRGRSGIGNTELSVTGEYITEQRLRNNPNLPTFILDGFEVGVERIYDLDPTRIETITILKDAASTSIYGARAANGVIVIETVKPNEGKLRVNYSMNGSVTIPDLTGYNLLDATEKLELEKMAGIFDPEENEYEPVALEREASYYKKLAQVNRGVNTYWLSKPLRTAISNKHNILLEGGNREFVFGLDLKLSKTDGVMKSSERDANAIGFSISYRKNNVQFKNYIEWNNIKSQESPYGSFSTYAELNPYDTYLDEAGRYLQTLTKWYGHSGSNFNPLYDANLRSYNKTTQNEFTNNFNFKWFITENLRMDSRIAITNSRSEQQIFKDPASSEYITTEYLKKGYKSILDNNFTSYDVNTFFIYTKTINNQQINITLGGNLKESDNYTSSYTIIGFPSGTTDDISFGGDIQGKPSGESNVSRTIGLFNSINYTFNNIYLLDISGRYDGASQFGNNTKFAPFWSIGVGLNIHNYKFFKDKYKWINNLKFRTNYGQLGKANFSQSLSKMTYTYNFEQWYIDGIGAMMNSLGNPNLEWEKTKILDAGFDLSIFDRFSMSASGYAKKTIDLIGDMTLPPSTGFTSFKSNLGEIINKGFEINASYKLINKKDYFLNLYATLAHNTNKFSKISDALKEYNLLVENYYSTHTQVNKPLMKYYEGASQTAIYAMKSLGINPADGKEIFLKKDGTPTYEWNASELVVVGDTEPKIRGAFGFNFSYKSFYAFTGFIYEFGGDIYNSTMVSKVENANVYYNVDRRVFTDRWQKPGDKTYLKDIKDWDIPTKVTSRFVQKNNHVSFNSLTIGYNFPSSFLKKYGIEICKLQITANDLAYMSAVMMERGIDYPYARTINLSLNLKF
jgi:TonB-linked SusC/RagA family outer membrane protein